MVGVVVHTYNLTTWEVEAGGSRVRGQPHLYSKFEGNCSSSAGMGLSYIYIL